MKLKTDKSLTKETRKKLKIKRIRIEIKTKKNKEDQCVLFRGKRKKEKNNYR